jgi:hypothetical protein
MKHRLIGIAAAISIAAGAPVWAQVAWPGPQQPQWAPAAPYSFNAPTPEDAYREGQINRWELERLTGPLPQALQGPSVNGNNGGDSGGGRD